MTTRRTFLQRLGIGIAGGAIVAKAATDARIPATGPTARLAEPEPRQIPITHEMAADALWFETSAPTRPMALMYWMPATTAISLQSRIDVVTPGHCHECREPLPLGAAYCIYCAAEVA